MKTKKKKFSHRRLKRELNKNVTLVVTMGNNCNIVFPLSFGERVVMMVEVVWWGTNKDVNLKEKRKWLSGKGGTG